MNLDAAIVSVILAAGGNCGFSMRDSQGVRDFSCILELHGQRKAPLEAELWREREGVEPPVDTVGCPPTDLKSAKPTRAHPLPGSVSV